MDEKMTMLIEYLKSKTIKRLAKWTTTSSETEFVLILNSGRVTIGYYLGYDDSGDRDYIVEIKIYNESGNEIMNFSANQDNFPVEYRSLMDLYNAARSSYYKTEETIESMMEELQKKGEVGHPF